MSLDRKALVLALVLLAAFGFGFHRFALTPKYEAQKTLDGQIAEQGDERAAATGQIEAGLQARGRYRRNYAAVVRLGKAVPSTADTSTLVYQLQIAARGAGVGFRSLKVASTGASAEAPRKGAAAPLPAGAEAGPEGLAVLPLELTFSGGFFGVDDLMRRIRSFVRLDNARIGVHGRLLVVDGFELAAADEGFPKIRATVTARAFLLPAGQRATGLADQAAPDAAAPAEPTPAPSPAVSTSKVADQ